jgi:hypothetical protein
MAWYPHAGTEHANLCGIKVKEEMLIVSYEFNTSIFCLQWSVFVQYSKQQSLGLLDHLLQES